MRNSADKNIYERKLLVFVERQVGCVCCVFKILITVRYGENCSPRGTKFENFKLPNGTSLKNLVLESVPNFSTGTTGINFLCGLSIVWVLFLQVDVYVDERSFSRNFTENVSTLREEFL